MISYLKGTLIEALPTRVILDVKDTGYEIFIPLSTFEKLPSPPAEIKLHTVLVVRETEHLLYGFWTQEEKDLHTLLVNNVSGVGPKVALAILSSTTPSQFKTAVINQDVASLSKIKGLGKKTAERIVVELKDKVGISSAWETAAEKTSLSPDQQLHNDTILALISLGYKQSEAVKALKNISPKETVEELLKEALKKI